MTKPTIDDIKDKAILDYLVNYSHNNVHPLTIGGAVELAHYIEALLTEARIDELNYVTGFGERGGHDVYCMTIGEAVLARIAQLKNKEH